MFLLSYCHSKWTFSETFSHVKTIVIRDCNNTLIVKLDLERERGYNGRTDKQMVIFIRLLTLHKTQLCYIASYHQVLGNWCKLGVLEPVMGINGHFPVCSLKVLFSFIAKLKQS